MLSGPPDATKLLVQVPKEWEDQSANAKSCWSLVLSITVLDRLYHIYTVTSCFTTCFTSIMIQHVGTRYHTHIEKAKLI